MCARFKILSDWSRLIEALRLASITQVSVEALPETVAPTLGAPVIVLDPEGGDLSICAMRFGLVPHWYRGLVKDFKATTFNARVETAEDKPVFKGPFKYRHAIVPAEVFYEWSGPPSARQKWRIGRADNHPLTFAGIWDEVDTPEGPLWSFALLTRPAGEDMRAIHEREPVILHPDQWSGWLMRKEADLFRPAPLRITAEI